MKGTVWKFGDDIDTDIILPGRYLISTDEEKLSQHCMEGLDDKFNEKCKKGTISSFGFNYPRADILGMLGEKEKCVDVNDFVPNYLRMTQAEAQWLEKHPEGKDEHDSYVEKI